MKFTTYPNTSLGKWSFWLVAGAGAVFVLLYLLGEKLNWLPDLFIAIIGSVSVLASLAGGVIGVIAYFKLKDRAVFVLLAILVGVVSLLRILLSVFAGSN